MLQNCPICNLDLDLVTNKDAHVNNCLENNNDVGDGRNLNFSGEFPASPRERGVYPRQSSQYNDPFPHFGEGNPNHNRRRTASDSSSEETIEEGDNFAGLYQYCDQTIMCVYPHCTHECNPMYFPTHALTEHAHERVQNLICPLCKFYDPGHQFVPKADSNLLHHLANNHSELIGIFDADNETEHYWRAKQREKERLPVMPKEPRGEKEPVNPPSVAKPLPVVVIEQARLIVPVTPHIEYYSRLEVQDSTDYLASVVIVDVPEIECIICLENFKRKDITARLLCMCLYHKPCIDRWWKNKETRHCPLHTIADRT